jgi:peptide/nickel transport system permease protein
VPWLIVGAPLGAVTFRMTRQVLHEELGADHIWTARAKGLSEQMVVRRHALRAGLPAIIGLAAVSVPVLVFNTILVETAMEIHGMFARFDVSPQVGVVHIPSIDLIQGLVLDSAIVIAVGLFACGVLHDRLDPQIRR